MNATVESRGDNKLPMIMCSGYRELLKKIAGFKFLLPGWQQPQSISPALTKSLGRDRCTIVCHGNRFFYALDDLSEASLSILRNYCGHILILNGAELFFHGRASSIDLVEAPGFKVFLERSRPAYYRYLAKFSMIDLYEFSVSSMSRLDAYPSIYKGGPLRCLEAGGAEKYALWIVFDLIQDFEILFPVVRAIARGNGLRQCLRIFATDRFAGFPASVLMIAKLKTLGLEIIRVRRRAPEYLLQFRDGRELVLITASESSSSAHSFNHRLCKILGSNALKVTVQHGFENIGMNQHPAHDRQFPQGVRFASDVIFTWSDSSRFRNIFPREQEKCIPVGVVKDLASDSSERRIDRMPSEFGGTCSAARLAEDPLRILVAENLQSVRFADQQAVQSFVDLITYLHRSDGFSLKVRSHPSANWLERNGIIGGLDFCNGALSAESLARHQAVISPPSSIILDSILCNVPTAIWEGSVYSADVLNYRPLPVVDGIDSTYEFCERAWSDPWRLLHEQLLFLAENSCAFNGTPYVLSKLDSLL